MHGMVGDMRSRAEVIRGLDLWPRLVSSSSSFNSSCSVSGRTSRAWRRRGCAEASR